MLLAASASCGPELTTPGDTKVTGTWFTADTARGITDVRLDLQQEADGAISGSWSARGVETDGVCGTELGCAPTNSVTGSNTVFRIHIELKGVASFTGQLQDDGGIRGHLGEEPMTFRRGD